MSEDPSPPYVLTRAIQEAVKGREEDVLDALGLPWRSGRPHIRCPYSEHGGEADWRWDEKACKARCTCSKNDSIFDVVMKCEGVSFEDAKLRVAEMIGRQDLIRTSQETSHQKTDADSLLKPWPDNRDDALVARYLAHRLGVVPGKVPMPSTQIAGLKALAYFDPPPTGSKGKFTKVGDFPCAVFGTVAPDGKGHAHRIYLAPDGAGKADLGCMPDGQPRASKKSAKAKPGDNTAGRAALWGDHEAAPWIILAEGIETAAAIAFAFRAEIAAGEAVVAAAISAGGVEAFQPWPATQRVTVAADRDEQARIGKLKPSRRGEEAARTFGLRHHDRLPVGIALPGNPGESVDWLDVLLRDGADAVRAGILGAAAFVPTSEELEVQAQQRDLSAELEEIARTYPLPALDTMTLVYERTSKGLAKVHKQVLGKDKEISLVPVATPFGVPARLRFLDRADQYGLRITVQGMDRRPHAFDVERGEFARMGGADVRCELLRRGLRIEADGELIALQCLKAADPQAEILIVSRPGWHEIDGLADRVFSCPDGEIVGAPGTFPIELSIETRISPGTARRGTYETWREAVDLALCTPQCEHWALGVFAGFVGPLIALTRLDSCGFNLSGLSSAGKSTAQRLAASAWSAPIIDKQDGLFQSAKATVNGMEGMAARSTGTILVLDELAHVTGKQIGAFIYTLAAGTGKRRMSDRAILRNSYIWSTFAMLSAENSLEEKVRADGGEWTTGMAVRLVDVDVTGINRHVDHDSFARINAVQQAYGHAGPMFVRRLVANGLHREHADLRDTVLRGARKLAGDSADAAAIRAAQPFTLLNLAGELAKEFDLVPRSTDVARIVTWAWDRYRRSSDAMALDPETQAIVSLRTWVARLWWSSIHELGGDERPPRDAAGWFDGEAVYIPRERLREAAGSTMKEEAIAAALDRRGLLARREDDKRRYVRHVRRLGKVPCYALTRREFGRSSADQETSGPQAYGAARG